jgi:hypothetical protein
LLALLAFNITPGFAAEPPPSLDELLKLCKDLGLPLPPKDAKLVRYGGESGHGQIVNGKTVWKTNYYLAFQIKPASVTKGPLLLQGSYEQYRDADSTPPKEVSPEPSAADGITIHSSYALLAIQCHARGWTKLAQRLFELSRKDQKDPVEKTLVREAWNYWESQITKPRIDRAPVAMRLNQIIQLDQKLDTKETRALIKSLELALVPTKAKPGSVVALIDELVDSCDDDDDREEYNLWRPNMGLSPLDRLGFEAVPALIEHIDDDRLTRYKFRGGMGHSTYADYYRVRDIVSIMLQSLVGRPTRDEWDLDLKRTINGESETQKWFKAAARKWFEEARKVGEERYVVDHVLFPFHWEPRLADINLTHLSLIHAKYPKYLPGIYRRILDKYPKTMPVMPHVISISTMPEREKLALLVSGAKHPESVQRCAALSVLRDFAKPQFGALLPAAIEALPTDVEPWEGGGPVELGLVNFALESREAKVWAAVEKVARRAKVGFRMLILERQLWFREEMHNKSERLAFLANFLTDATVYDREENKQRFPFFEPSVYEKIEVRNFAALKIAEMLDIKIEVNPRRTPEEWTKVREQMREALKREHEKKK